MPSTKKNPTFIKGRLKAASIPKGKRKGETFMKSGKRYMVISYVTDTGKRVRYAQAVSKTNTPGKGRGKAKRRNPGRKNPWTGRAFPTTRKAGTRFTKGGQTFVVRRQKGTKTKYAQAADVYPKIPKGKSVGETFSRGGTKYKIYKRKTPKGGYKRYVKPV